MRTSNLGSGAIRQSDVGLVWREKITLGQGTIQLIPHQTFRVRASAGTTVTIDGILAATMAAGEIMIFCAGKGIESAGTSGAIVDVVIAGANAYVQVADL